MGGARSNEMIIASAKCKVSIKGGKKSGGRMHGNRDRSRPVERRAWRVYVDPVSPKDFRYSALEGW